MGKLIWTPATLLAPVPPALVSCGTLEHPNVLTVAWTGIVNSDPAMTYVSIRPSRYSHDIIKESGEFVINLTSKAMVWACDYCGVRTGAKEDKIKNSGLTVMAASKVSAPIIAKSPLALECKVKQIISMGSHDMFLAEIVAVDVDEQYVNRDGRLRLDKAELVAYAHGAYYELGKQLGTFGFSVSKKLAGQPPKPAGKTKAKEETTGNGKRVEKKAPAGKTPYNPEFRTKLNEGTAGERDKHWEKKAPAGKTPHSAEFRPKAAESGPAHGEGAPRQKTEPVKKPRSAAPEWAKPVAGKPKKKK